MTDGQSATISGTATDAGGGVVAGVEVSTDDGGTWHPATSGTTSWSYTWIAKGYPSTKVRVRATDDSGNTETPGAGVTVNVNCPCSIMGTGVTPLPEQADGRDASPAELGVKFRSDKFGTITALRFYKATANTGTHTGSIWSADGQLLAQATFQSETAAGGRPSRSPTRSRSSPTPRTSRPTSRRAGTSRPRLTTSSATPRRVRTAARCRAARRSARCRTRA